MDVLRYVYRSYRARVARAFLKYPIRVLVYFPPRLYLEVHRRKTIEAFTLALT